MWELWWEGEDIAVSKHITFALDGPSGAELEV